ncbi:MAG: XTP/dITP diphosphatase [Candidatus Thermoplasmatota archaeon]|nr:XTP/dITP diphosphatase [Candidatus Thermoplasmatota archaeon]
MTSNEAKFREVSLRLEGRGVELDLLRTEYPEIQADRLEDVVNAALGWLAPVYGDELVVDDSGLFVRGLAGFPGVYSSFVYRTLGCGGILRLLEGVPDRGATFQTVLGLRKGGENHLFVGKIEGTIAQESRGSEGFGFDPIFVPEGASRTFAQMTHAEKNAVSHRGRAADVLAGHLTRREEAR